MLPTAAASNTPLVLSRTLLMLLATMSRAAAMPDRRLTLIDTTTTRTSTSPSPAPTTSSPSSSLAKSTLVAPPALTALSFLIVATLLASSPTLVLLETTLSAAPALRKRFYVFFLSYWAKPRFCGVRQVSTAATTWSS